MIYLRLYWEFFKVGLFAIGGGLATIPFLYQLSDKTAWFTAADIVNMFAISEVTPGPVGINMATFAGVHTTGLLGGLIATIGIVTPALLAVVLIAGALKKYMQNKRAQA
ncbi:MAG: chromate transporter, partial [Elusimicrobiota bacterium]|nr:chromate transporter [Elusimicrobiota bacterium]